MRLNLSLMTLALLCGCPAYSVEVAEKEGRSDARANHQGTKVQPGQFVVHEWGTFTTFSGSDGAYLDFRPWISEQSDLPSFVFDRAFGSPTSVFAKSRIRGKVRMETPVTYFYTDRIRTVQVKVAFPQGLLTEFYPPVREMLPRFDSSVAFTEGEPLGNSSLDWGQVTLIPLTALVPTVSPDIRESLSQHIASNVLPRGSNDGHYVQARATDSALVHVKASHYSPWNTQPKDYLEKFLFYRGVGQFELPVRSTIDDNGVVRFRNDCHDPITAAVLIRVRDEKIEASLSTKIEANSEAAFPPTGEMSLEQLSKVVQEVLVTQGLFEKEAKAMVETWKTSWFAEEGTRVLYIVPEPITDELLPLTVQPAPDKTLRVLVGRMELMSPESERRLITAVKESGRQRDRRAQEVAKGDAERTPFPLSQAIRRFGRMVEPGLVRVSKIAKDPSVRLEAELLIRQMQVD